MSYDVSLCDPATGEPCIVSTHEEGGTYVLGGTDRAELNITYNYSPFFREHIDSNLGLRWLYGKTGRETAPRLATAVATLGDQKSTDYWAATEGNAGAALRVLLSWATAHPNGVWEGR